MRFTEILIVATVFSGVICLWDILFLRKKRNQHEKVKDPLLIEYARAFFPILIIVFIIRAFIIEPFRIPSGSMRPTVLEGDFVLVNRFVYGPRFPFTGFKLFDVRAPKRGEVIVFKHDKPTESMDMIKRVIGLPGDHIQYKDKTIYINGVPQKQVFQQELIDKEPLNNYAWQVKNFKEEIDNLEHEIYLHSDNMLATLSPNALRQPFHDAVVPEKHYFVMGDNRDNSRDSREWGFVHEKDILGRALGIWFSWNPAIKVFSVDCVKGCVRFNRIGQALEHSVSQEKAVDKS